jgi:hypothetical protein
VSDQLRADGVAHALIDTDELDRIHPVPDDLSALSERNLAAVWRGFHERGSTRLILVGVFADMPRELAWIRRSLPGAVFTLVRLEARWATLAERIEKREIGSGRSGQLERTRRQVQELAREVRPEVHAIDTTGLGLEVIAREVRRLWLG